MPRLRTMFWYFARPTRRITPSLRPPSRYSCTSISTSSPVHSWKAPLPSAEPVGSWLGGGFGTVPDSPAALFSSLTWKRNVRSSVSATTARHGQRSLAVAREAKHEELERLRRRDADVDDELAGVGDR